MYLLGYLLGVMVDPLSWGVALASVLLARQLPWLHRVGIAVLASMGISILIITLTRSNEPSNGRVLVFTLVATAVWALMLTGAQTLWARRTK